MRVRVPPRVHSAGTLRHASRPDGGSVFLRPAPTDPPHAPGRRRKSRSSGQNHQNCTGFSAILTKNCTKVSEISPVFGFFVDGEDTSGARCIPIGRGSGGHEEGSPEARALTDFALHAAGFCPLEGNLARYSHFWAKKVGRLRKIRHLCTVVPSWCDILLAQISGPNCDLESEYFRANK